jgi:hypothetical protein
MGSAKKRTMPEDSILLFSLKKGKNNKNNPKRKFIFGINKSEIKFFKNIIISIMNNLMKFDKLFMFFLSTNNNFSVC